MWLGKLTALDMTPLGWLGRKTSTQTNMAQGIFFYLKCYIYLIMKMIVSTVSDNDNDDDYDNDYHLSTDDDNYDDDD